MTAKPIPELRNPQATQMADESMVRTLAAQIAAIWPQEQLLLRRYASPKSVLDVGCGTGEFSRKIADFWPDSSVLGVDIVDSSLAIATARNVDLASRLSFERDDAFHLAKASDHYDLVACRHVLQAIPAPELVIAELVRVTRPGGWIHVLSEDYGMLHMMPGVLDPDLLWRDGPVLYGQRTGTNARIGRHTWSLMRNAGLLELQVDYVVVDTIRVPRQTFADILIAWRDGYVQPLAEGSPISADTFQAQFDQVIASVLDPNQYAVWMVPVVSGRKATAQDSSLP